MAREKKMVSAAPRPAEVPAWTTTVVNLLPYTTPVLVRRAVQCFCDDFYMLSHVSSARFTCESKHSEDDARQPVSTYTVNVDVVDSLAQTWSVCFDIVYKSEPKSESESEPESIRGTIRFSSRSRTEQPKQRAEQQQAEQQPVASDRVFDIDSYACIYDGSLATRVRHWLVNTAGVPAADCAEVGTPAEQRMSLRARILCDYGRPAAGMETLLQRYRLANSDDDDVDRVGSVVGIVQDFAQHFPMFQTAYENHVTLVRRSPPWGSYMATFQVYEPDYLWSYGYRPVTRIIANLIITLGDRSSSSSSSKSRMRFSIQFQVDGYADTVYYDNVCQGDAEIMARFANAVRLWLALPRRFARVLTARDYGEPVCEP